MRAALCTLALAVAVAGCSDSNSPKSINGTYSLESVGGDIVPTIYYSEPGYSLAVIDGAIRLNSNGTFIDEYTLEENDNGYVQSGTVACNGTWTRSGNDIELQEMQTSLCGDFGSARWDGSNTLTVYWESLGLPAVHRR